MLSRKVEKDAKLKADKDNDDMHEIARILSSAGTSDQAEQSKQEMDIRRAGQTELETVLYTGRADTVHLYSQGSERVDKQAGAEPIILFNEQAGP